MFAIDLLTCAACKAKAAVDTASEMVTDKVADARLKAGEHSLKQLKSILEESASQVHTKPDITVKILKVEFQEGLDVDIFNFSASGLKCRVKLEVTGSAAEIAAMAAADAAKGAVKKIAKMAGGYGESLAQGIGGLRDKVHAGAAEGQEVKSVEFDMNLDLGVRKGGEEVSAAVSIVGDALDEVNKVIPVKTATRYVEQAITDKVKEIITAWAKEKVKSKVGVDVDQVKDAGHKVKEMGQKAKDMVHSKLAGGTS